MEMRVEVRPPASGPDVSVHPEVDAEGRLGQLADAIVLATKEIRSKLDASAPPEEGCRLDSVEVAFQLDLASDSGVVLVRASEQHVLSVKCTFKRSSRE
jgi:hypothetical protein